jgi:catechol 2,3-dioxygenase-like lactoylglutathione lyase family enzyme
MEEDLVPILRVKDAAAAAAWYSRLGFTQEWLHHFEPGFPAFVSIARDKVGLFLSEREGFARPDTLIDLSVSDVGTAAKEFDVEINDQSWANAIEMCDPDGIRLRSDTPRGCVRASVSFAPKDLDCRRR